MAHISTETITIKISRICKDSEALDHLVNDEMTGTIEAVVQELVGESAVVEIGREDS